MNRELERDSFPGLADPEWTWLLVNYTTAEIDPRRSAAHAEVFEHAYTVVSTVLDHLPRSTNLDAWWMSNAGQVLAELLWNCAKDEDVLYPHEAIAYLWGDYTTETYHALFLRLKRAYMGGKIWRLRIPENRIKRRTGYVDQTKNSSAKTRNWWFWRPDLDKFRQSVVS